MDDLDRRKFVKMTALGGFGLLPGIPIDVQAQVDRNSTSLQPLIRIDIDGQITLFAQNPEMGQGNVRAHSASELRPGRCSLIAVSDPGLGTKVGTDKGGESVRLGSTRSAG